MWRRVRYVLHALAGQSARDWADVLRAQSALFRAQMLVWTRPSGRLVTDQVDVGPVAAPTFPPGPTPEAVRLARAVRRAADYGLFRPTCLVRSVALSRMLERSGVGGSRIRIGVRMEGGDFAAHAWVELDGCVLGDAPRYTRTFEQLVDVRTVSSR